MAHNRFALFANAIILYRGRSCLVSDREGRIRGGAHGFYFRNTRFLSRLEVLVGGRAPRFVSANAVEAHSAIAYYLAPSPAGDRAGPSPERTGSGGEIAQRAIELQVNRFVDGGLHQTVRLTNHGMAAAEIELALDIRADFADRSEVKGGGRKQLASVEKDWELNPERATLCLRYTHPELQLATLVRVGGAGCRRIAADRLQITILLPPRHSDTVTVDVCPRLGARLVEPRTTDFGDPGAQAPEWAAAATELRAASGLVQRAWNRAAADLRSLALPTETGRPTHAVAGGIPVYQGLFGRDVLIAGIQAQLLSPLMLRDALALMAQWQGRRDRPERDEEPGKMLHQRQLSPLAVLGDNPFLAYYGDYTAPAMFLIGAGLYFAATADRAFILSLRPHILAVLDWMQRRGDSDGDDFYEYETRARGGLKNQGWKDSGQAVLYPDGRLVDNPIAMAEIQAAYYAAQQLAGLLFLMLGEADRGQALLRQATALKRRFNERFWLPDQRYFAVALDPAKQPVATAGPDAGQCLAYGIADADKSAAVVARLMRPDLFSGWGVRTLSSEHPAYNPFGYHLGDVWPWANALIGFGLRRFGFEPEFERLARGILDAAGLFACDRLPEAIGGHPRDPDHPHPGIYPDSNSPQAWSASAIVFLIETMLGIVRLAPLDTLLLDPVLPEWLPEVTLSNLRFGRGRLDLRFRRDASGWTRHEVLAAPEGVCVRRLEPDRVRGEDRLERQIRAAAERPLATATSP